MAKIYFTNYGLELARAKIFNSLASKKQLNIFDVFELSSGDYLPKTKMEDGKHIVYGGGGLTNSTHKEFNIKERTLGIGRVGARCGCCFIIEPKSWVTDNALFISKLKHQYDYSFLMHYLNHLGLNKFANQSAQPVISQRGIAKCTIPSVDINEQVKIASILDAIENGNDFDDTYDLNSVLKIEKNLSFLQEELKIQQTHLQLLRQAILQEAVQGKLSELGFAGLKDARMKGSQKILPSSNLKNHSADNEDAATLLQRIRAEKQKLIAAGKLKKEKELPPITEEEIPFELPKSWVWCRLGEICIKIGSGSTPRGGREVYKSSGIKFIRSQNVYDEGLIFQNVAYIDSATHKKMDGTKVLPNDILLNITGGSIGRCALVPSDFDEANVSQHVTIVRLVSLLNKEFIHWLMLSPYFQDYIMATQTGGNREGLAKKNMELMLIPLPPLSEQHRIVAKVQQLLQLVNQLEQQVATSQAQAGQLLQAVLKEAFRGEGKGYKENEVVTMAAEE